jgi:Putative peptidoglycan binding domain
MKFSKINFYLSLIVILSAVLFLALNILSQEKHHMMMDDHQRNENSTPRTFILPATPAVAKEQEDRESNKNIYFDKLKCVEKLERLNYDIGDELVSFNAKLKVAIYEFQKTKNIRADGILNSKTKGALGC